MLNPKADPNEDPFVNIVSDPDIITPSKMINAPGSIA